MTCGEFLTLWNDRLDDPASVDPAALDAHATDCAECGGLAAGFRLLELRYTAGVSSEGLADRILDAWRGEVAASRRRRAWAVRAVAGALCGGAIAAAAAALFYVPTWHPFPPVAPRSAPARPWTSALADATSATLDLARETSAPAARIGQVAIQAATPEDIGWPRSLASPSAPSGLIQSLTDRVNSGVRPLSGSARRAFSFLSAPPGGDRRPARGEPGA